MELKSTQYRAEMAETFFNLLYGKIREKKFGYLWTKQEKATYPYDVSIADNRKLMAKQAIELSDKGFDVYAGINLGDEPPAENKRFTADKITMQTATITDIDVEGGDHISADKKLYPPTFDVAKSFLPFTVSFLVDSGFGLHGYCLYSEPITITAENRDDCTMRNKNFIEVIRRNAGKYSTAVDGVGDLPRVLRVAGTYNYKCGKDNAPLCKLVEDNGICFTPAYMDERLNALTPLMETKQLRKPNTLVARVDLPTTDAPEYDLFRAERMLDVIRPAELSDTDWLAVQSAAKNISVSYAVLDAFNRRDEKRYSSEENQARYDSLKDPSFDIRTLHGIAKRFGYDEKDSQREWYKLHPNTNPDFDDPEVEAAFRNRVTELAAESEFDAALKKRLDDWQELNGKINPATLGKLKTALDALDALTPESFKVADVDKHKQNAALALTYSFRDAAEKYFKTIKAAKEIARDRIRESDSDLTKKLSADELNALTALAEGVDIKTLRRDVDREVTALDKAHKDFIKAENARIAKEKYAKAKEIRAIEITNAEERLKQLKAMEPSKERDAELVDVIRQLCEWKHNKYGEPVAVAGTQANAALILGNDPDLDELFGFDEFAQADVFLKPAPWKKKAKKGDEWTDRDDSQLRLHIRDRYTEFANKELIADNITKFSDERAFHEVKDYFKSLPPWDKKPRAETLFIDWLKVDDTPFVREVTMKILMAAVARIYYPGCTFQNAVIIHGNQKIGKGYILERLGGKWYKAITDHVDDPHAVDAIRICWIGEFKEMASMRKADVNAIKEFIELSADTRRFAYDRRAKTVPRHCVFFITVNDDQFLADMTGNRRFWILHSPLPKFGYVKEVRGERLSDDNVIAQIWAEVLQHCKELFKDGFDEKKLVLSTESEFKGEEIAEQYLRDDGLQGEIQSFLDDTKILPPVIWNLLSKEQRRQFVADNGVFAIEEEELAAKFKASRKIIPPELQAEFDAAIKPCDFVHRTYARDKKTGEVTTYLKFIGNVYRQHICAAEIRAECFDKSDRRAAPQRINETLTRLEGWSLGKRIQKNPEYGDQRKVYYRTADNVPADDEPPGNPPVDEPPATEPPPDTTQQAGAVEEEDFDLSQFDE